MTPQPIELRKTRDFGQIINDSFTFLKENFKPLMAALLVISGFFLLMEALSSIFTYAKLSDLFTTPMGYVNPLTGIPMYTLGVFIDMLFTLLSQMFINLITICYISVYIQKNNVMPTVTEVWNYFKYYFFRVAGAGIIIIILVCAGAVCCIIPGIYLMVPLYLVIPIIVIENAPFGFSFNKSFRIIKDNWWFTFGIIIVMSLIVSVSSSIVTIPLTLIGAGNAFLSVKSFTFPFVVIFAILKSLMVLAYTIPTIGICLCYFSFVEQKDGTGLMSRIENLGKTDAGDSNLPAEEY